MFPLRDASKSLRSQRFRRNANQNHWEAHVLIEIIIEADRTRTWSVERQSKQLGHQTFRLKFYQNDWEANVSLKYQSTPSESQCFHRETNQSH